MRARGGLALTPQLLCLPPARPIGHGLRGGCGPGTALNPPPLRTGPGVVPACPVPTPAPQQSPHTPAGLADCPPSPGRLTRAVSSGSPPSLGEAACPLLSGPSESRQRGRSTCLNTAGSAASLDGRFSSQSLASTSTHSRSTLAPASSGGRCGG